MERGEPRHLGCGVPGIQADSLSPPASQSTNESVLTVEFNPQDSSSIITSGKSHVYFWTWSGATLTKKQGIFGVRGVPQGAGGSW